MYFSAKTNNLASVLINNSIRNAALVCGILTAQRAGLQLLLNLNVTIKSIQLMSLITMELGLPDISQSFQKTKGFLTEQVGKAVNSVSEVTVQAKSSLSETADKAKESLTQTTNSAVEVVNQAKNNALGSLAETTAKARHSLSEVTNQAVTRVSETTNKAVDAVSHSTATAKETLTQATNSAVTTLNQTTSQAVDTVTQATEKAKISLQDTIHRAENISSATSDTLQNAINASVKDWIDSHPLILWLVSHPLIALPMLLLSMFIILGFFQALGSFLAKVWLFILQLAGKLMQAVFLVSALGLLVISVEWLSTHSFQGIWEKIIIYLYN